MPKFLFILCLLISLPLTSLADLKDPTKPPSWSEAASLSPLKGIELNGIFTKSNQNIAAINNVLLKVGDSIQGYQVSRIESNIVYLKNKNGVFMVPLADNVKTLSSYKTIP